MCVSDDDCGHRYLNGNILPHGTSGVQGEEPMSGTQVQPDEDQVLDPHDSRDEYGYSGGISL